MEAGDRATGNGDEEEGEDPWGAVSTGPVGFSGDLQRGAGRRFVDRGATDKCGDNESDDDEREGGEELEGVDEVARLQQGPNGEDRGDVGVDQQDRDPDNRGPCRHRSIDRAEEARVSISDGEIHHGKSDDGGDEDVDPFPVQPDADDNGDRDLHEAGEDGGGIHLEDSSNDQAEDGEDDGQGHEKDGEEEEAGSGAEDASGDVADSLAAMTHGDDQCAEIMDCADEDGAEQDPEESRKPAPDHGEGGSDNRAGAGDGGEVVAEDNALLSGNVVLSILQLDGRDLRVGVQLEDLPGEPASVGVVGDDVENQGAESDGEGLHEWFC